MAADGNYIKSTDVDNWIAGATDADKQAVIDRIEEQVERLTKDCFYPKAFDVRIDGNGKSRLFLGFQPDILSISSIKVSGITLASSWYTHDKNSVYLDSEIPSNGLMEEETVLFPRGRGNIHIIGTMGWPDGKLDIDNVSGIFQVGETISAPAPPDGSGATATVKEVYPTYLKIINRSATNFVENEQITGGTSGATADVDNVAGAVNDPPKAITKACIILCRYENDPTLYTKYYKGTEKLGDFSYATSEEPLAGVREADVLLRSYVRKKPMIGVV
ncbi:hypothetical protein ES703_95654 [subsurface metagenome]